MDTCFLFCSIFPIKVSLPFSHVLMKMTRKPKFSKHEIAVLLEEVENNKVQLFSKLKKYCITNTDKYKIWAEITKKINDAGYGYEQSPKEVRNKWRDFASVTKRRAAARFGHPGACCIGRILGGIDTCASTRPLPSKFRPPTSNIVS